MKNTNTSKTTKLALILLIMLSTAYLIAVVCRASSLEKSVKQRSKELQVYQKKGLGRLNREKDGLEKQLNGLEGAYGEITGLLTLKPKSKMPNDSGDPLKFKEELYKVQNKLKEEGQSINFEFPFWLGFDKYEHNIPIASDLPIRVKQLDIIKEIGNLMLKSGIASVTAVEFEDVKNLTSSMPEGRSEPDKEILYREIPVKVVFACKNSNLINFLYALSVSDIPFNVTYMKLKSLEGKAKLKGDLSIELVIAATVFP